MRMPQQFSVERRGSDSWTTAERAKRINIGLGSGPFLNVLWVSVSLLLEENATVEDQGNLLKENIYFLPGE